jgi:ribonuclease HII
MNALQSHDADILGNCTTLVGIDEAGRGALAGPVVAGACCLKRNFFDSAELLKASAGINDSKQLKPEARKVFFANICDLRAEGALDFAVARGSVQEIADLNILGATRLAMQRAVEALAGRAGKWELPVFGAGGPLFESDVLSKLIVDGRPLRPFPYEHQGIIKGDGKSLAIAIASIAAKVTRDRELVDLDAEYPAYGFSVHKGYATKAHREAILAFGPSPIHRELFLRKILPAGSAS